MLWLFLMFTLSISKFTSFRINLFSTAFRKMDMRVANNYLPQDLKLPVLYEDDHIIAINKPANIRSVPGIDMHRLSHVVGAKRSDEWMDACKSLVNTSSDEKYNNLIIAIAAYDNCPRRLDKFTNFVNRRYKVTDQPFINQVFHDIEARDKQLHELKVEDMPLDLISVFDVAQHMSQTKCYIIHRLDMETSGIILFAKNLEASIELCRQFRDREIKKVYIAKVWKKVDKNLNTIDVPIGLDVNNNPVQKVDLVNGKESLTLVRVIDDPTEYHINNALFDNINNETTVSGTSFEVDTQFSDDTSLVELRPHTGRTHQLRVHMSHVGHPMLGDTLYAPREVMCAASRLCLHARMITLKHPVTKQELIIDSIRDCREGLNKRKVDEIYSNSGDAAQKEELI